MEYLAFPRTPMYGAAWEFGTINYGVAAYSKPALALTTLERTLGEETMLGVMSTFYQRYRFAHPTTEDFRAAAAEVSGQDLDWFFDGLVYGDGALDYAVTAVTAGSVTVSRRGELVIPTEVAVTFADGSTVVEPWDGAETERTWTYSGQPPVQRAEVDPGRKIPLDLNWGDNSLSRLPQLSPWLAVVFRLLDTLQHALLTMGGL
jgi:hypothetical protein